MCTDWVSAILPVFIIIPLQMSIRKKILAVAVLGLGVFASVAAVARLPVYASTTTENYLCMLQHTRRFSHHATPHLVPESRLHFRNILTIPCTDKVGLTNLLSHIECGLAIIGGSMAPLRKMFVRFYRAYSSRSATKSSHETGSGVSINRSASSVSFVVFADRDIP